MDGKNYPELRGLAELLGLAVGYDAQKKIPALDFTKRTIPVDGQPVEMDTMIVVGKTMVPLTDVVKLLGGTTDYDADTKQISIKTK